MSQIIKKLQASTKLQADNIQIQYYLTTKIHTHLMLSAIAPHGREMSQEKEYHLLHNMISKAYYSENCCKSDTNIKKTKHQPSRTG